MLIKRDNDQRNRIWSILWLHIKAHTLLLSHQKARGWFFERIFATFLVINDVECHWLLQYITSLRNVYLFRFLRSIWFYLGWNIFKFKPIFINAQNTYFPDKNNWYQFKVWCTYMLRYLMIKFVFSCLESQQDPSIVKNIHASPLWSPVY